jgi:transcriptional regulator GlxA family with amidase domain
VPAAEILDLAGPVQVFHEAGLLGAPYELLSCATTPRVRTNQGLWLCDLAPLPANPAGDDLIVVPGLHLSALTQIEPAVLGWLRAAHAAGVSIASVCTGAFVVGAAGLLDGRQCTTHWSLLTRLQQAFPATRVLANRLYVTDGPITTSAGIASGIDMALALVEARHGPRTAAATANEMVVYMRRDGMHRQHSVYLDYRTHLHPGVHRVQDWLVAHAAERSSLDDLARLAAMSPRHLTRVFRQATGISIRDYSLRLRLELAGVLLHEPHLTIEAVAERCGFASARQLRRQWRDTFGTTPSQTRGEAAPPAPGRHAARQP